MPPPIKLMQVTPSLMGGGIENRTARLLAGLPRNDFSLAWAGFAPVRDSLLARAGADVERFVLPPHAPGFDWSTVLRLARLVVGWQADVVHVHNWSASLYGVLAARLAGVPTVLYGVGGRDGPQAPPLRRRLAQRALSPLIDGITTVSDDLAERLRGEFGGDPARVRVVRTGVDLERFHPRGHEAARAGQGWPQDAVMIGISGVHRPVKRLGDFLQAAELLIGEFPRAYFVLVGFQGAEADPNLSISPRLRARLWFLGQVDRVDEVLPGLDLYVCTSAFEGASNAIIEAMACGLPVVATRIGGNPELVRPGENGLLYEVADVRGLAEAIRSLLWAPILRSGMGTQSRRRATLDHDGSTMIRTYAKLYREYYEGITTRQRDVQHLLKRWIP